MDSHECITVSHAEVVEVVYYSGVCTAHMDAFANSTYVVMHAILYNAHQQALCMRMGVPCVESEFSAHEQLLLAWSILQLLPHVLS
jgi:hypothetical protein